MRSHLAALSATFAMAMALSGALAMALAGAAFGQTPIGQQYAGQPPAGPPQPDQQAPSIDAGVMADANSGRVWFAPTAQTPPAGSWSIYNHEILLIGATYAPADQMHLGVTTLFPITSDMPLILLGTAKYQAIRTGRLRMAAHANLNYFSDGESGDSAESFSTATIGGAATLCIDPGCHSLLNGYLGAGFLLDVDQGGNVPFIASVGAVFKIARRVRIMLEVNTGFVVGDFDAFADGALAIYGFRFTSTNIGVDFGAVKLICEDCSDDELFPLGIPYLSFTYRSGRYL